MKNPMAKKTENDENFKKYRENMDRAEQDKMVPPPELPIAELISYLAAEGAKLLEAEEKAKKTTPKLKPKVDDSAKLNDSLASTSKNPYVRARALVLSKMAAWKRKEIEEMEKNGNMDNDRYKDFIAEVAKLGDTL